MKEPIIGTSAYPTADAALMKDAGIGWVRVDCPFPFVDRVGGVVTERYAKARETIAMWAGRGFLVMGVTPLPGSMTSRRNADGTLTPQWKTHFPDWAGALGSAECNKTYEAVCAWLANDLRGMVPTWQVANELDISTFAGPLNPRQGCDLVLAGARGLKSADPSLLAGHNPAGNPAAYFFFARLFERSDKLIDYCGVDSYYGTWNSGGPESWAARITELRDLTDAPVLVNEWGFSSRGELVTPEERATGASVCQLKKWRQTWGPGHTPEGQAQYVSAAFDAFAAHRKSLLGMFFYRWEDQAKCWQCGAPDCPAETAWGLVDMDQRPKPAFHAHKEGVRKFLQA